MSSALVPATPLSRLAPAPPSTPPTGTWQHPSFDEIARRRNLATFTDRNVKSILWNAGMLLATWFPGWTIQQAPLVAAVIGPIANYIIFPLLFARGLLVFNIFFALVPLMLPKDEVVDIPLTPSQRALLGLDPKATPPGTPTSAYVTPPRYPQSTTPRTGSSDARGSPLSGSPLSGKGSPLRGMSPRNSSFAGNASPLLHKALQEDCRGALKRQSQGSSSPLGSISGGLDLGGISLPATPTPSRGKGASVGLNSKWLYERGRGSPVGGGLYS